jgi:cytochrome P450
MLGDVSPAWLGVGARGQARVSAGKGLHVVDLHGGLPSGIELSELDPVFREAPHARLDRLRSEAPRYLDPAAEGARLFLTRHVDVRAVIADRSLTRDAAKAPSPGARAVPGTLLSMEGQEHLAARKLIARAFEPKVVEARRGTVTAIVEAALAGVANLPSFDAIADLASPVPVRVMAEIFGLPLDNLAQVRTWSEDAAVLAMLPSRTDAESLRLMTAVAGLQNYVFSAIAAHRQAPGADLITDLISADVNGRHLRDEEIGPLCMFGLIAGSLTTTDLIGNAIVLLLQNPEQRAVLEAQPELIGAAVDEALRIEPPVSAVARHAVDAREILGCPVRAGGTVKASLLAANHDPEVFIEPHAYRLDRDGCRHVSFGGGTHACLGAGLARLEAQIAIERLFARFPKLRLDPDKPLERKTTYGFRGYVAIPLCVD